MTVASFTTAGLAERRGIIAEALEKVLDRGPEMSVVCLDDRMDMVVAVISEPVSDSRHFHSLYDIACELEVLLV